MSDSESDKESPGGTRRRKRRTKKPEKWAQNVAKELRNRGQAYTSVFTKKQVGARSVGKECRDGCFEKVKRRVVDLLFKEFWEIGNFDLQNAYIQKLVRPKEIKRRRKPKDSNSPGPVRSCTYEYTVTYSGVTQHVCKQGFLSIFGLKKARVETAMRKVTSTSAPTTDQRGRHNKRKMIVGVTAERVREHIQSIPSVSSHYNRRYLDPGLNVNKLYGMYCEWIARDYPDETRVKESYYRHVFNTEFNLFFQPTPKTNNRDDHHNHQNKNNNNNNNNNNNHNTNNNNDDNNNNNNYSRHSPSAMSMISPEGSCQTSYTPKDYARPPTINSSSSQIMAPTNYHHPQYYII